jgi:hypothetical protein
MKIESRIKKGEIINAIHWKDIIGLGTAKKILQDNIEHGRY